MSIVPDTTVTDLEDAIVAALHPGPDETRVEPWPDDPSDYRVTSSGALLVILQDESYDTIVDETVGLVGMEREPRFNVVCVAKARRTGTRRKGQGAAYDLIEYVLSALAGTDVAGYTAIPADTQALGLNTRDKTWRYRTDFRLRT
jgi:hypothetical protein